MRHLVLSALCALLIAARWQRGSAALECDMRQKQAYAEKVENHLDITVEPCDDFYEYACGNWRLPYALRALQASDTLSGVRAENKRLLLQHLNQPELNASAAKTPQLLPMHRHVHTFYQSCVKAQAAENNISFYIDVLKQLGRWPTLHASYSNTHDGLFKWQQLSAELRRYGVHTLWRLQAQPNWQAAEQTIFYIMPPAFDMLKKHRHADTYDDTSVFLYERYVKYLMLDLGVRVRKAKEVARQVVQFEKQLMDLHKSEQTMVVLREPQPLHAIAAALPNLQLQIYFRTLLQAFALSDASIAQLSVVADMHYLQKLNAFIETTTDEAISIYFVVQFLAHFELHMHVDDTYVEQKQNCLQKVNNYMPLQLSAVFLELLHGNVFDYLSAVERQLEDLFEKLKLQFEHMLNATHVFERDSNTRALGLAKLRAMRLQLPNLQQYVAQQHEQPASSSSNANNFVINENYDLNLLNLAKQRAHEELYTVLASAEATAAAAIAVGSEFANQSTVIASNNNNITAHTLVMGLTAYGPLDVNAYYRLKRNAIEIPFGILRPPFYDSCLLRTPQVYGSFVYILAHELLHGFDYDGLNYDQAGNVANNWSAKTIIDYGSKAKCYLSTRYRNAALTINENIADSEGLRLALETFVMAGDGTALQADDLRWFFIGFAQTWCGANGTATASNTNSLHSTHRDRVNNVVANFEEFARVFKCNNNNRLNPDEKCKIW